MQRRHRMIHFADEKRETTCCVELTKKKKRQTEDSIIYAHVGELSLSPNLNRSM